ncbi:MAG: acetyl-CoA carboxylase biotin carboxyl carrier protein [Chlamydiales bacterium]
MELKQIKDLMSAMERTGITKVRLKKEDFEIELERESHPSSELAQHVAEAVKSNSFLTDIENHRVSVSPSRVEKSASSLEKSESDSEERKMGQFVTSPMVGTLYLTPAPGEPNFIKVGDTVQEDTVVCIVEAMKVMNEVKAGINGTVVEILMDNGHPVEFGTKLFRIV